MSTDQTPTKKERTMSDDQVKVVVVSDGCTKLIVSLQGLNDALNEVIETIESGEFTVGNICIISVEYIPKAEFESLPVFDGF